MIKGQKIKQEGGDAVMSRRKQRRLSKTAAVYIPVGAILIVLLFIFGVSVFMKIIDIDVVGASMYSDEEIIDASGLASGDNLLFVDEELVKQNIHLNKPFVKNVTITRLPPSAIRIEVTESQPMARIDFQDVVLVIDSDCRVLMITDSVPDGLIEVLGVQPESPVEGSPLKAVLGSDTNLEYLKNMLAILEKEGMEKDVTFVDVSIISKINFGYLGRFRVILGDLTGVRNKLNQLPGIVDSIDRGNPGGIKGDVDISIPSAGWRFNEK